MRCIVAQIAYYESEARAALAALREERRGPCGCGWCCASNPPNVTPGSGHDGCPAEKRRRALAAAPSETEENEREVAAFIKELAEGEWTIRPTDPKGTTR